MVTLLHVLLAVCATIYGGTVVSFAVLFVVFPAATGCPEAWLARVYRSVGPILGLSMGGWVLAQIAGRYAEFGRLQLHSTLDAVAAGVFVALWFSSFVLEIWTMDRLRSAVAEDGTPTDLPSFTAGMAATRAHLAVNAGLVVAWHVIHTVAEQRG
jgi:hypothetical protein